MPIWILKKIDLLTKTDLSVLFVKDLSTKFWQVIIGFIINDKVRWDKYGQSRNKYKHRITHRQ